MKLQPSLGSCPQRSGMRVVAMESPTKKQMIYREADGNKRQEFVTQLGQYESDQIIWIDECGLNQELVRLYGRSSRGQRIEGEISGKRITPRVSLIAAYCDGCLSAPCCINGYTDTQIFNMWLETYLLPSLTAGQVLILDNATFHKSDKTRQLVHSAKCHLLFLPPYSPDLNKIEHQWAVLKQGIRANSDNELTLIQKIDQQLIKMSEP